MSDMQMSLGDSGAAARAPLAERMRPETLDEVVGQKHVVGPGSLLRAALEAGEPYSFVLHGKAGIGKTTIAKAAAREFHMAFEQLNSTRDGIKEFRAVAERAAQRRGMGQQTLLFLDEIARWSKAQQDALLPEIESGTIVLIGATTENPAFQLNSALRSRIKIERLQPLTAEDMRELIHRVFTDVSRGLGVVDGTGRQPYRLAPDAEDLLLLHADGDARALLNGLGAAALLQPAGGEITREVMERALGERSLNYGNALDQHYDTTSALIKSIRGSDPDAALYYLARMQAGGEDPSFVARRLVIAASEEVGVAASGALTVATAGFDAVQQVGPPECWINLAHVCCYLATAPKSWTSYHGWKAAQQLVAQTPAYPIPKALRNPTDELARAAGHGEGYVHASQPGAGRMRFMPDELGHVQLYKPTGNEAHRSYKPTGNEAHRSWAPPKR